MGIFEFGLMLVVFIVVLALTGATRRYALAKRILDIPNARSSHAVITPRGGGVAIVIAYLGAVVILSVRGYIAPPVVWSLLGSGGAIALLGFWDDHNHVAARWRLAGHFMAAIWGLAWLQGMPALNVGEWQLELGWPGFMLGGLYLVWLLNLYNFMDGIDGIASIEAFCTGAGGALLYWMLGYGVLAVLPALLVCAVAGFLLWNLPPARIFMGDSGSGFLGVILGLLSLQAGWVAPQLFFAWLILLGIFIVDATLTLCVRISRRERLYEAHRKHAYQHAAQKFGHLKVTMAVFGVNVLWLLPCAIAVALSFLDGVLGLIIAYAPLVCLARKFGAGHGQ